MDPRHKQRNAIICRCNNVSFEAIAEAIRSGATTLDEVFDETTAGVGPCGGSCRLYIKPMIDEFSDVGTITPVIRGKK